MSQQCSADDARRRDRWSAKYELLHTVRTHMGASDANFGCVVQREDANGKVSQAGAMAVSFTV